MLPFFLQLGIAIVNDFKSIEGDRALGLQVLFPLILYMLWIAVIICSLESCFANCFTITVILSHDHTFMTVTSSCFWHGYCKVDMRRRN